FDIRYYLWAQSELDKERNESFANLRLFKAGAPRKFYQFIQQLEAAEQLVFGAGRLKKFHPNAVQSLAERYSPEEETLLSRFEEYRQIPLGADEEIEARILAGDRIRFVSKRKLRKLVTAKFKDAFGRECLGIENVDEEPELQFKMKICGWVFDT